MFLNKFAFLFLLIAVCSAAAVAQKQKSKEELVKEISALLAAKKPEDTEKAYGLAKEFLARFGKDNKDGKDKAVGSVKNFVDGYRESIFYKAVDASKFAEAFAFGREILAEQPENLAVLVNLAYAGYNSMGAKRDRTYADETIGYAKKVVPLLESGLVPKEWAPFKDREETMAWMYFVPGFVNFDKDMKEAAASIYKATTFNAPIKDSSMPYYLISAYYEDVYGKLATDLKAKVAARTMTDAEFKTANDRVNRSIELMMDAYARAYKKGEAEKNPNAAQWKDRLTQVYKYTKKTEEGLPEFINYVVNTPLPDPSKF